MSLFGIGTDSEEKLWDKIDKVWNDAEDKGKHVDNCLAYWNGDYDAEKFSVFNDQKKTTS